MPPTPEPKPKVLRDPKTTKPVKAEPATSATGTASASVPTVSKSLPTQAVSLNKRRKSHSHETSESVVTGSPKRARPEAAPAKILPQKYEFCEVEDVVVLIANMLGELIETNDALALKSGHLTRFHSR
jgi:hypothetical protein